MDYKTKTEKELLELQKQNDKEYNYQKHRNRNTSEVVRIMLILSSESYDLEEEIKRRIEESKNIPIIFVFEDTFPQAICRSPRSSYDGKMEAGECGNCGGIISCPRCKCEAKTMLQNSYEVCQYYLCLNCFIIYQNYTS